jgi:phosphate transport system substrate-binding protein
MQTISPCNRRAFVAALFAVALPVLAGCNPPAPEGTASPATTAPATDAKAPGANPGGGASGGKIAIEGSNTMLPLAQKWADAFKKSGGPDVSVQGAGSGQGITALINGTCQIANASRPAKDEEKEKAKAAGFEMYETAVARDGITIVVNPSNPIKELTLEQLANIYAGKVKNWKEVGGPDLPITASGRDTASGTYAFFLEDVIEKKLGKGTKYRADMSSTASNPKIGEDVAAQKGGIGYIGIAYASEFTKAGKVKEVPISFETGKPAILPNEKTVLDGTYPISRALFCYTKGTPEGDVKKYLDFVTGAEGQAIVKAEGYIPLK